MLNVAESLKKARIRAGLTQKNVYENLGIAQSTYSSWEIGKSEPDVDTIAKICRLFKISINDFFEWERWGQINVTLKPNEHNIIKKFRTLDLHGKKIIETVLDIEYSRSSLIPQIKTDKKNDKSVKESRNETIKLKVYGQKASVGLGSYLYDDDNYDIYEFLASSVPKKASFGIRISGDCMEPKIQNDQIVFIETVPKLDDGEIGIFIYGGEVYCKKLKVDYSEEAVHLISINEKYPPRRISDPEVLKTVGRVLL